jgi:hypothetical protein
MQFRMVCEDRGRTLGRSIAEVQSLWQRLKSAQRQRRYRKTAAKELWADDWRVAEKNLGRQFTGELRRFQERLLLLDPSGSYASGAVQCAWRTVRTARPSTPGPAQRQPPSTAGRHRGAIRVPD